MDERFAALFGSFAIAFAFVLMAWPLGILPFAILCYAAAGTVMAGGVVALLPRVHAFAPATAYGIAALAVAGLVYQLLGTTIDLLVFVLLAFGLASRAYLGFTRGEGASHWSRLGILLGAIGAAVYFVNDVVVGYSSQLPADVLLAVGFTLLWWGASNDGQRPAS